ncbi:hypothetical protein ACW5BZ_07290 [Pediococcus pentosaceus]
MMNKLITLLYEKDLILVEMILIKSQKPFKLIKPYDPEAGRKLITYIPFWGLSTNLSQ